MQTLVWLFSYYTVKTFPFQLGCNIYFNKPNCTQSENKMVYHVLAHPSMYKCRTIAIQDLMKPLSAVGNHCADMPNTEFTQVM